MNHELQETWDDRLRAVVEQAESPIEAKFLLVLMIGIGALRNDPNLWWMKEIDVLPQQIVQCGSSRYRVDVALHCGPCRVAVECDGHEFHEKNKQQVARDKKRDRALLAAGYSVVRFSGSEICKDPIKCATEALELVCGSLQQLQRVFMAGHAIAQSSQAQRGVSNAK